VEREPFQLGQRLDGLARGGDPFARRADELHGAQKRLQTEPARPAGEAAGREDVVRTCGVVAEDGGRAEEDGARVPHPGCEGIRVRDEQLEVLGRDLVRTPHGVRERGHGLDPDPPVRPGESFVRDAAAGRDEDRLAVGTVLGLGEEVGGALLGVGGVVGDDEDLTRTSRKVDRDVRGDEQLRRGDNRLPGPTIFATGRIVSVP
jgi:hypothetical protein